MGGGGGLLRLPKMVRAGPDRASQNNEQWDGAYPRGCSTGVMRGGRKRLGAIAEGRRGQQSRHRPGEEASVKERRV